MISSAKVRKLVCAALLVMSLFLLCDRHWLSADDEADLFSVAQKAFDDGFYDVAIRYINQFLEEYPQSEKLIQAKILLGQCYFFLNQYLKAYDIFQTVLTYSQFQDATLFWLGETLLKGSDYTQAEKYYKQVMELYPDSIYRPQAYYSLGWTYFEAGDYGAAKNTFSQLISQFPTHQLKEDALFKVGECLYNQEKYEQAIHTFQEYLEMFPQSNRIAQIYFYIGESYYYQDDSLTASTFYAKASDMSYDPKVSLMAKISQGWCYLKLQRYELSQRAFEESLKQTPNQEFRDDIYLGQATLATEMDHHQKAIEYYSQLIAEFPSSPRLAEAYLGRANSLYMNQQFNEAIAEYTHLITKVGPTSESRDLMEKAYFGLAWTYLKNNQPDLAIAQFQKVIDHSPSKISQVSALVQIADAYQEINQLDKAIEIYDKILKEYTDSVYTDYAQYRQGIALLKQDKIESATLSFKTLAANFPKSKYLNEAKYFLGVAYYKKEDWATASHHIQEYLNAAASSSEFLAEATYILALCYSNLNESKKALKTFQEIIKSFPSEITVIRNAEMGIAKSLYNLDQIDEAIEKFKSITEKYSDSLTAQEAFLFVGNHYLTTEDYTQAIQSYTEILKRFPTSPQLNFVNYAIAQAYEQLGQYEQALNYYRKITDPSDHEIYAKAKLAIAEIFAQQLDPMTAIQTYENIIVHSPDFKRDAYVKMAELYKSQQNYDKALEAYQQALSASSGLSALTNPEIQFYIADTYELLHNTPKAIEEYFKIPYLYPTTQTWVIKSYLHIARLFEDDEKWEEAKMIYNKVLDYKTEEAIYANERLDWIKENVETIKQP